MAGLYDMVKMTVAGAPGTATITLSAAVLGFQSFAAGGVPSGQTVSYFARDGALWELGRGVYTSSGTTLSRGPLFSSAGGAAVSLTSAAIVGICLLAEDFMPAPATALTAAGNNSQGGAFVLTTRHNSVDTVTSTNNSVKILAAMMIPGTPPIMIANNGGNILNVFGDTGVSIGSKAANASAQLSVGVAALFFPMSSTALITIPPL